MKNFIICLFSSVIAIWKRKILIPPDVDPEHAPAIIKNAKRVVGNAPHAVKSSKPKPVVVTTETILNIDTRRASKMVYPSRITSQAEITKLENTNRYANPLT